ncbi:MAG: hypothetical protein K0S53_577 [Bacteroidetes bacterium]|jgi:peptidoglycan/LPS O-acetylase OafA/YrhL|nr:hypothetical protein [Bacteroidota bacterium]MDF2453954.1 hypothetical protein [Bacteroidota bacterium]
MASVVKEKLSSITYFKGLDMLRFIGSTVVIFHHTTDTLLKKGFETKSESYFRFSGAFFLDVFFIISGFLISLILMKEFQQGTFSIKNFYLRRIIRIWPLYFLVVLVKVLIIPLAAHYPWDSIKSSLFYACTFMVNFQILIEDSSNAYKVLWSVCIEEHIYLVLPLFLYIFKGKFKVIGWVLTISGLISWFYFKDIPSPTGYSTPYFMSLTYFYFFGLGVLIAYFYNKGVKLKMAFEPLIQIIVIAILIPIIFNVIPHNYKLPQLLFIYGFFGSYLVWAGLQDNFVLNLKTPVTKYLGNLSFSMYMIHIIIVVACVKYFKRSDMKFSEALCGWAIPIVATLITMVFSTLLYYFFEKPILKLKSRFTTVKSKILD